MNPKPFFFEILIGALVLSGLGSSCATSPVQIWDSIFSNQAAPLSPEEQALAEQEQREARERAVRGAIRNRDITVGMSREDVARAWGEPRSRELAGDGSHGNERWVYSIGVSSYWSLAPRKYVYFERGAVVGWETQN